MNKAQKTDMATFIISEYFEAIYPNFAGIPRERLGLVHECAKKKVIHKLLNYSK